MLSDIQTFPMLYVNHFFSFSSESRKLELNGMITRSRIV